MKLKDKGSSLYFAVVVLAVISGIVLGISSLLINQVRVVKGMVNSVAAFYLADSGIEHISSRIGEGNYDQLDPQTIIFYPSAEGTYTVKIARQGVDPGCDKDFCVKSVGEYQGVKRAIEIKF